MFAEKFVQIGHLAVTIREYTHLKKVHGGKTWDVAELLAKVIAAPEYRHQIHASEVVELGCGTGLVGLTAVALGAKRVTLTDGDEAVVAALQAHVASSKHLRTAEPVLYQWSTELPEAVAGSSVVLAADCCYSQATTGALCDALDALWVDGVTVLLALEYRWSTRECFDTLQIRGWSKAPVLLASISYDNEKYGVFQLTRQPT